MKIRILAKCQVYPGVGAIPGDVLEVEVPKAIELEAHGFAAFEPEAEIAPKPEPLEEKNAKPETPAHKKVKSHKA